MHDDDDDDDRRRNLSAGAFSSRERRPRATATRARKLEGRRRKLYGRPDCAMHIKEHRRPPSRSGHARAPAKNDDCAGKLFPNSSPPSPPHRGGPPTPRAAENFASVHPSDVDERRLCVCRGSVRRRREVEYLLTRRVAISLSLSLSLSFSSVRITSFLLSSFLSFFS